MLFYVGDMEHSELVVGELQQLLVVHGYPSARIEDLAHCVCPVDLTLALEKAHK